MIVVEAKKLTKHFKKTKAVEEVSLEVDRGEVFGFLGPNGAGKSTLIKMLCTMLKPTSGTAEVAGYNIIKEPDMVRQNIGLVFQDPTLDERLTARENLLFHAMLYSIPPAKRRRRIAEVLQLVELSNRENDLVRTFSGGMRRRLEIARGLIHFPRVLFLDEPTVGLDPQTRKHIWNYIHELKKQEKITIFLTTHYMEEAENCNRIAIIDRGKIVAEDTPLQLKENVGGDLVTIRAADEENLGHWIKEHFRLEPNSQNEGILVKTKSAEEFIPALIKESPFTIKTVHYRKPTLEDVFLKLTGHAIRDEKADEMELFRTAMRRGGRK